MILVDFQGIITTYWWFCDYTGRLDHLCPISPAMVGHTVIEWDKNDLDALGILKVDVLGLGMLSCIRRAFD